MANPSNDDGHPIGGQIERRSGELHGVQNFRSARAPVSLLRIGNYQIRCQNASHLTAKWYYMNKQLNWEILEGRWKKKIEINWSNIAAIRVGHSGDLRILEIELYEPPRFYSMGELRPRVRASWNPISDFTDGQASTYRIHHLEFPHGTLERKMEPLFLLDSRLGESTGRPFPSLESPFFVGLVTGAPQAPPPPPPPPSINSQLLQYPQIPPNHSSVSTYSSNSNPADSISTGPQSANYRYLQPSSSLRRSAIILNLGTGHSEPGSGTVRLRIGHSAHDVTASSSDPDNTRHGRGGYHHQAILNQFEIGGYSGFISSSNRHLVVELRRPSSSNYSPTNDRNEPPHSMP